MKKFMVGLVAVSSLVFGAGCGSDTDIDSVCEDFHKSLQSASKKGEACGADEPITDAQRDAAIAECKRVATGCNEEDREKIAKAADCLSDIDECRSEADQDEYVGSIFACLIQGGTTSDSCQIEQEDNDD